MLSTLQVCLLIVTFMLTVCYAELTSEDCGDVQHDVENGMIRLPDFSGENVRDLNCSWTYSAPSGRMLLIKVDSVHLPPSELRTSQFQFYVDDRFYDIPRNCVQCIGEVVAGNTLRVSFTSYEVSSSEFTNHSNSETDGIGSFQIRYKTFDPHRCPRPEQIENGLVLNKGRKVGQSLFYSCNQPYDLIGSSELKCVVTGEMPVPSWSEETPKCMIQDCTGEPIRKRGLNGAIASPGFSTNHYEFTVPCLWEIIAQPNQFIKVSVTYLKLPKHTDNSFAENMSRLSLYDGDTVLNLTESLTDGAINFTTLTNSLTVEFIVETESKKKEEIGFYLEYSITSNSCPKPQSPVNGGVITHGSDLGSKISYSCKKGYVLVGESHAECLFNRQWSHPTPTCEQLSDGLPPFFIASNDSDTVTTDLDDNPETLKSPDKNLIPPKGSNYTETKVLPTEIMVETSTHMKKSGPKSEPHLLQVVPDVKKSQVDSNLNLTSQEELPSLDKGYGQEVELMGFKINIVLLYIIGGAGIPLIIIIILLIVIIIYRKKYPVRMRFGRKFSTFENPMYVSKDVQHPRELKRLTN